MATTVQARPTAGFGSISPANESSSSAISWGAVIGGALAAAAMSLTLLALGAGIGLSAVSPWTYRGASETAVGAGAIIWLIVVQLLASALGGYLAGRLRTKWVSVHTHEVYFRDTVHGFLTWCVGLVVTAAFLASAAAALAGAPTPVAATATTGGQPSPYVYFVDSLFRSDHPATEQVDSSIRTEAGLIFARGVQAGNLSASDEAYLTQLVSARTGLNETEAQRRVTAVFDETRQAADQTRKALAHSLYWTFLALLIGAFCASYAATLGGRQRDRLAAETI